MNTKTAMEPQLARLILLLATALLAACQAPEVCCNPDPADDPRLRLEVLSELRSALETANEAHLIALFAPERRAQLKALLARPEGMAMLRQWYLPVLHYRFVGEKKIGDDVWSLRYSAPGKGSYKFIIRRDPDRYRIVHDETFITM